MKNNVILAVISRKENEITAFFPLIAITYRQQLNYLEINKFMKKLKPDQLILGLIPIGRKLSIARLFNP